MEENNHEIEVIETNDVLIQVEQDEDSLLVASILSEISPKPSSQCSIFKVPLKFRTKSDDGDAYEPHIVSIGPYHHGKESFKTTEQHKKWYVHDLISRKTTPDTSLMNFVQAIRELEGRARECYAEPINFDSNSFVKMMVFDGCFILELLYKYNEEKEVQPRHNKDPILYKYNEEQEMQSQHNKDPIFGTTWMVNSFCHDLVLLENQLPFIVLKKLFDLTYDPRRGGKSLNELVALFFNRISPTIHELKINSQLEGEHILDLFRNHLIFSFKRIEYGDYPIWEYTNSATDLWETGVKFKKKENAANVLLDITFTDDGVLEIPPFIFGASWKFLLPNLIALEQFRRDYTDQLTSYGILVNSLINSGNDVKLLRNAGIIDGLFADDEKVAVVINNLCKGVDVDRFYYGGLCNRVNAYCKTDWHRWRAALKRDYFNTPWAYFSFLAAVILLLLTLTQTIFSTFSYSP